MPPKKGRLRAKGKGRARAPKDARGARDDGDARKETREEIAQRKRLFQDMLKLSLDVDAMREVEEETSWVRNPLRRVMAPEFELIDIDVPVAEILDSFAVVAMQLKVRSDTLVTDVRHCSVETLESRETRDAVRAAAEAIHAARVGVDDAVTTFRYVLGSLHGLDEAVRPLEEAHYFARSASGKGIDEDEAERHFRSMNFDVSARALLLARTVSDANAKLREASRTVAAVKAIAARCVAEDVEIERAVEGKTEQGWAAWIVEQAGGMASWVWGVLQSVWRHKSTIALVAGLVVGSGYMALGVASEVLHANLQVSIGTATYNMALRFLCHANPIVSVTIVSLALAKLASHKSTKFVADAAYSLASSTANLVAVPLVSMYVVRGSLDALKTYICGDLSAVAASENDAIVNNFIERAREYREHGHMDVFWAQFEDNPMFQSLLSAIVKIVFWWSDPVSVPSV